MSARDVSPFVGWHCTGVFGHRKMQCSEPCAWCRDEAAKNEAALTAAGYAVEQGWQPIETAPKDRLVEVYAPSPDPARWTPEVHDLPSIVCLTRWHPDGGFCVCEIREVTHWREHVPPAGEVK